MPEKEKVKMMIKAAIFDVDDTLYEPLEPFRKAFEAIFPEFVGKVPVLDLYVASRRHSEVSFKRLEAGEISFLEHNIYRLTAACADFGIDLSWEDAVRLQEKYQEEQGNITLFPEMAEAFEKLQENQVSLGVLTNGPFDHQWKKIKQLGLMKWISEGNIFVSEGIGFSKPDIAAFRYVEEKMGLEKSMTVFIGDSFENDITGAKNAGWKAVWLNHRRKEPGNQDVTPDEVIYSPKEILDSKILFHSRLDRKS